MNSVTKIGSAAVCFQIFALGVTALGWAQEGPPASDEQTEETLLEEEASNPGFEVVPPSQEGAISILPLEEMPAEPQEDPAAVIPDAGVEDTQPDRPPEGAPGFAPLQDETENLAPPPALPPFTSPARSESSEDVPQEPLSYREVTVRALEKVTARTEDIVIPIGETVTFKTIDITLRTCNKRPPEEPPETTAFLEITEEKSDGEIIKYFTGWMFASSPALNGLEHPVYDVWVIDCKISDPVPPVGIE